MATAPLSRTFLVVALVSGTVIAAAVLLWVFDVIPMAAFIGVIVVVFVLEALVILSAVRRTAQGGAGRSGADQSGTVRSGAVQHGVASPPGTTGTDTRGASTVHEPGLEVGYDPMERFRPPSDRSQP